ncbi:eukaryotic translation initiation factor 2 [Perkinsus olseni]|uniref:Eukaryotic translation initiation factor 2 n=2 Tax=Perkinsus olseni TaxID=32597 RepID=A0A7J6RG37_PEROL|nr:eukaryotic translation initiation factor 2 [Perkinsus olseni]
MADVEQQLEAEHFDFGKKKKKSSKEKKAKKEKKSKSSHEGEDVSFQRGVVYPYEQLLARVHEMINEKNPALGGSKRAMRLPPPKIERVGSKRVSFVNFGEICARMNRSKEHVLQFFLSELGTTGSLAADGQLILKGRYMAKHIESLLRKYLSAYVTCPMCKSLNTEFVRDPATRLYAMKCNNCGASRTVHAIKSGFHATTRADRKAAKLAK